MDPHRLGSTEVIGIQFVSIRARNGTCHAESPDGLYGRSPVSPGSPFEGGNPMNSRETKNLVTEARDYVVSAIQGVGDVAGAIADAMSGALVRALRGTRATGAEIIALVVDTITGAIHGVAEVGGEVGSAARSIMLGALRGTQEVGKAGVETVSASAAALVRGTSEVGGNVGQAAKGAVEGAIAAARDLGMTAEDAAAAAGSGALRAAGEISSTAVDQVRSVLTGTISGVKVVLKEPFRSEKEKKPKT